MGHTMCACVTLYLYISMYVMYVSGVRVCVSHYMCVCHTMCVCVTLYLYINVSDVCVWSVCVCVPLHVCVSHYIYISMYVMYVSGVCVCASLYTSRYGVATISRLLKIIGLFCKRAL